MTKLIAVTNQKGGVGKTTISMLLARALHLNNKAKVLVVDCDRSRSALHWAGEVSGDPLIHVVPLYNSDLDPRLDSNVSIIELISPYLDNVDGGEGYDYIIFDSPPAVNSLITDSLLLLADLVIIPFVPGGTDYRATTAIHDSISGAKSHNSGLLVRLLLNRVVLGTIVTEKITTKIADLRLPSFTKLLSRREAYNKASLFGGGLTDYGRSDPKAVREFSAFTTELVDLLANTDKE